MEERTQIQADVENKTSESKYKQCERKHRDRIQITVIHTFYSIQTTLFIPKGRLVSTAYKTVYIC